MGGVEIPVLRIVHQKTRKGWKTVRSMQKAWWIPFDAIWFDFMNGVMPGMKEGQLVVLGSSRVR